METEASLIFEELRMRNKTANCFPCFSQELVLSDPVSFLYGGVRFLYTAIPVSRNQLHSRSL